MGVDRDVMMRLRGTRFSAAIRKSPTASHFAQRWWYRSQYDYFMRVCPTIGRPSGSDEDDSGPSKVDVPTLGEMVAKLPDLVTAGEKFSEEMSQWCRTSKFLSYTARPDSVGYQDIYARILKSLRGRPIRMLEIGIGVNAGSSLNPTDMSSIYVEHGPGDSLAGWCGYFPDAEVHGADVDRRVLKDTDRYQTHYVDQRDPATLRELARELGGQFDLMVDDGLHTPEANVNVMAAFLPMLKPHGVMTIEDISPEFDSLWFAAADRLPKPYSMAYFPSAVLRQFRGDRAATSMAVITRR